MFSGLLQKDQFKGKRSLAKRYFKTKLLSRLSHKVCRLLTSPVLLRKFTRELKMETFSGRRRPDWQRKPGTKAAVAPRQK